MRLLLPRQHTGGTKRQTSRSTTHLRLGVLLFYLILINAITRRFQWIVLTATSVVVEAHDEDHDHHDKNRGLRLHDSLRANNGSLPISPECQKVRAGRSDQDNLYEEFCQEYYNGESTCQVINQSPPPPPQPLERSRSIAAAAEQQSCKTLWISGFTIGYEKMQPNTTKNNQGQNANSGDPYWIQYGTALQSWYQNAQDVLQPVLILLSPPPSPPITTGTTTKDQMPPNYLKWLENEMGVIVLHVHSVSFQQLVYRHYPEYEQDGRIGYYLRFDIPQILAKAAAKNSKFICNDDPDHHRFVLYTDTDVVFTRPISHMDIQHLKEPLLEDENKILRYGQDFLIDRPKPCNTGVMVMDTLGFAKALPDIIEWGNQIPVGSSNSNSLFPEHDQLWLNRYYARPRKWKRENSLLPPQWNWKVYWQLPTTALTTPQQPQPREHNNELHNFHHSYDDEIFLAHYHGPKPGEGVEEMAYCDMQGTLNKMPEAYQPLIRHAICCDHGKTAYTLLHMYQQWKSNAMQKIFSLSIEFR